MSGIQPTVAPVAGEPLHRLVCFTVGASNNGPFAFDDEYLVECSPPVGGDKTAEITCPNFNSPCCATVTGLLSGPVYSCSLRAKTRAGALGPLSDAQPTNDPPCSAAVAPTAITGDPQQDGWFRVGSSDQAGVYVAQKRTVKFDVYTTSFRLTQALVDSVQAARSSSCTSNYPSSGTPCAYLGNAAEAFTSGGYSSWAVGDTIIGIGFKYISGQVGTSQTTMFPKLNQDGRGTNSGGIFAANDPVACSNATACPGASACPDVCGMPSCSLATCGNGSIASAAAVPYLTEGRIFSTFRLSGQDCTNLPTGQGTGCPFGNEFLNTIEIPWVAGDATNFTNPSFHANLPVRSIGRKRTSDSFTIAFEFFYSQEALARAIPKFNGSFYKSFGAGWRAVIGAANSVGDFVETAILDQPLVCQA